MKTLLVNCVSPRPEDSVNSSDRAFPKCPGNDANWTTFSRHSSKAVIVAPICFAATHCQCRRRTLTSCQRNRDPAPLRNFHDATRSWPGRGAPGIIADHPIDAGVIKGPALGRNAALKAVLDRLPGSLAHLHESTV